MYDCISCTCNNYITSCYSERSAIFWEIPVVLYSLPCRIILIFVTYVLGRVLVITPPMRDMKGLGTISTTVQCLLAMRTPSHIAKVIYFSTLVSIQTSISLKKLKRTLSDQRKLYSTFKLLSNAKKCKSHYWLKI